MCTAGQPASHASAEGLSHYMVVLATLHTTDSWEPLLQQPMCSTLINTLVQVGNSVSHEISLENTRVGYFSVQGGLQ